MARLKFVSNYQGDEELCERMRRNFLDEESFDPRLQLTAGSDYDALIVFNGLDREAGVPRERVFGFLQEPSWSGSYDRDLPASCGVVFAHAPSAFPAYGNVRFHPAILPTEVSGEAASFKGDSSFDKPHGLSFVVSALGGGHNYEVRRALVRRLLASDLDFHLYGRGWQLEDRRYLGPLQDKRDGLAEYRYSIAIENCCERGYVTEKLFDCFLCNCVPIYLGAPDVAEIYPAGAFLPLDPGASDLVEHLRGIASTESTPFREQVLAAKRRYFAEYNPYLIVRRELLARGELR